MVRDLNMTVGVVVCDTQREADGLAMSSRNIYLTTVERPKAATIWKALNSALALYCAGERSCAKLLSAVKYVLETEPGKFNSSSYAYFLFSDVNLKHSTHNISALLICQLQQRSKKGL
jgi:pantothenate synthetase